MTLSPLDQPWLAALPEVAVRRRREQPALTRFRKPPGVAEVEAAVAEFDHPAVRIRARVRRERQRHPFLVEDAVDLVGVHRRLAERPLTGVGETWAQRFESAAAAAVSHRHAGAPESARRGGGAAARFPRPDRVVVPHRDVDVTERPPHPRGAPGHPEHVHSVLPVVVLVGLQPERDRVRVRGGHGALLDRHVPERPVEQLQLHRRFRRGRAGRGPLERHRTALLHLHVQPRGGNGRREAAIHLMGALRGVRGVIEVRVVAVAVPDGVAHIEIQCIGGDLDAVVVGVPAQHRVLEHQRRRARPAHKGRVFRHLHGTGVGHLEFQLRIARHRDSFVERDRELDLLPLTVGVLRDRRPRARRGRHFHPRHVRHGIHVDRHRVARRAFVIAVAHLEVERRVVVAVLVVGRLVDQAIATAER